MPIRLGLAAIAAAGLFTGALLGGPADAEAKPNIVVVVADDMETRLLDFMPSVRALIRDRGASLNRAFFNDPLCCPSRATILTGRYAHNTGVTEQRYSLFLDNGNEPRTVAVWLDRAGYNTALVGKYMNGYGGTRVPPGWDYWAGKTGSDREDEDADLYYGIRVNINGALRGFGGAPSDYSTDVYRRLATDFLDRALRDDAPFFLYLAPSGPHAPHTPAPRHAGLYPGLTAPKDASFNEADVRDKPAHVRRQQRLSPSNVRGIDRNWRLRAQALASVDEAVADIVGRIERAGRLDDTYVVFTSDNGWVYGQHRVRTKGYPYEPVIRMPLLVRGPGIEAGAQLYDLATNADLAPTIAAWAGVAADPGVDGRRLDKLLEGEDDLDREAVGIENAHAGGAPPWIGVRARDYAYARYATGEEEVYDMARDPLQLSNIARTVDRGLLDALRRRAAELARCGGEECRALEDAGL